MEPLSQTIIVVPCYNEAQRLRLECFQQFLAEHPQIQFLFVDDGSKDGTADLLEPACAAQPESLRLLKLAANGGKAEAVRAGFLKAFESKPAAVGFWDADLSTPLDELPRMLDILEKRPEIEMVFGARVNLLGRSIRRKLSRHYIGRVFATFVAQLLGLAIYDTQCGAKVFRTSDELQSLFQAPFLSRWIFDVEIIARSIQSRKRDSLPPTSSIICEMPLKTWVDVEGSKLKLKDFFLVARDLVRIYFNTMRSAR